MWKVAFIPYSVHFTFRRKPEYLLLDTHSSFTLTKMVRPWTRARAWPNFRQPPAGSCACRLIEASGLMSLHARATHDFCPNSPHIHGRLSIHHRSPKCKAVAGPATVNMSAPIAAQPQLEEAQDPSSSHQTVDAATGLFKLAQAHGAGVKSFGMLSQACPNTDASSDKARVGINLRINRQLQRDGIPPRVSRER